MIELDLGPYHLTVATKYGPRISGLRLGDGPELFAALGPEVAIAHAGGTYRFHGGHRLWAAPEVAEVTYASDDHECAVVEEQGTITVSAPADGAGLAKEIEVSARDDELVVSHRLTTSGPPVSAAAWAITQFPIGGSVIVPLTGDDTSPLPNRRLGLWPYTSLSDPRLELRDHSMVVVAADGAPWKVGTGSASRRLGYLRQGHLFTKEVERVDDHRVPDFGSALQVYVGQGFCELESMGMLRRLAEEGSATHEERWRVVECDDLETAHRVVVDGAES